jgi:hypothetical protein
MFLRVASVVGGLTIGLVVGLTIDLGVPGGQALAQYYPAPPIQPYPSQSYPAGRQLPPPGPVPGQPVIAAGTPIRGTARLSARY